MDSFAQTPWSWGLPVPTRPDARPPREARSREPRSAKREAKPRFRAVGSSQNCCLPVMAPRDLCSTPKNDSPSPGWTDGRGMFRSAASQKGRRWVGTKENRRLSFWAVFFFSFLCLNTIRPLFFCLFVLRKLIFPERQPVWRVWCPFCPVLEGGGRNRGKTKEAKSRWKPRGGNYRHPVPATKGPLFGVGGSLSNQQKNVCCMAKENHREFLFFFREHRQPPFPQENTRSFAGPGWPNRGTCQFGPWSWGIESMQPKREVPSTTGSGRVFC